MSAQPFKRCADRGWRPGRRLGIPAAAAVLLLACAGWAQDGCPPEWTGLDGGCGSFGGVLAFERPTPGPNPALYVGGAFSENIGGVYSPYLAMWDGFDAAAINGLDSGVERLLLVPEGVGNIAPGLYATGDFPNAGGKTVNCLARWDGESWHEVGGGLTSPYYVIGRALCLFDDDGDGVPALFVGGGFDIAGGIPARSLARWDGEQWTPITGLAFDNPDTRPSVYALAVFDDGRGPALYVGGSFDYAGDLKCNNIARWDGNSWEPAGNPPSYGPSALVEALAVFDEDGNGPGAPVLIAAGDFPKADGKPIPRIARWDGHEWTSVGGWNASGGSDALAIWQSPDDDRPNLYMGGFFSVLPDGTPIKGLARWDGQVWRGVDYGVGGFGGGTKVDAIMGWDEDGDGPNPGGLYIGGMFTDVGTKGLASKHIARWGCPLPPDCQADIDNNGTLDIFDFLTFLNLFSDDGGDPAADCDANGTLNLFDFLCFVNLFNQGC